MLSFDYPHYRKKEVRIMAIRKPFNLLKKGFIDPKCKLSKAISEKITAEEYIEECIKATVERYNYNAKSIPDKIISNINGITISTNKPSSEILNSGSDAKIVTSGRFIEVANTGNNVKIMCEEGTIMNTGNECIIGGLEVKNIVDNGFGTQIVSVNKGANIICTGPCTRILSKGSCSTIVCNGRLARISSEGEATSIICNGYNCVVKAKLGSTITLSECRTTDKAEFRYRRTVTVDGTNIKADTWYMLKKNRFVEVFPEGNESEDAFERDYYSYNNLLTAEYLDMFNTEKELLKYAEEHNDYKIDWYDESQPKYILVYKEDKDVVKVIPHTKDIGEVTIAFSSEEIAKAAVKAIGEEAVSKLVSFYSPLEF